MIFPKFPPVLGPTSKLLRLQAHNLRPTALRPTIRSNRSYTDPKNVITHQIVPVHMLDISMRSAVVYHLSRFDAPLDAKRLRDALVKLIDRDGGWRKLGARLRLNDKKVPKLYIPNQFNAIDPVIAFHHELVDSSLDEHPLASQLPSASQKPALVACASDSLSLMRREGDPASLEDYLDTDRPLLGLRIISFNDGTLVTLSSSHALFDGLGRRELMEAWSLVLHGRPDLQGVFEDPLAALGTQPEVPYKHASRIMGFRQLILFAARALFRGTFFKSDIKDYVICIPGSYVEKLRSKAIKNIVEASGPSAEVPFLSDSDILCAWWSRYVASCLAEPANKIFVINTLLGLRPLLTPEFLRSGNPYISNAFMMMPTFVSAAQLLTKPLGEIALSIRQTIRQLSTREQVEARISTDRAWQQRTGFPALYGDPWMRMLICTNWIKSRINHVDFSPAVLDKKSSVSHAVVPTYTQLHAIVKDLGLISGFAVSKDVNDNYWIYSQLDAKHRPKVEQMLSAE